MAKVRPIVKKLNNKFKKFEYFDKFISIDKQMVPYFGLHSAKMFIKGKPIRFGYKNWVMASKSGYIYSFEPYYGKNKSYDTTFGLGASVVLNFIKDIESSESFQIYFDNFFSSYKLFYL